MTIMRRIKQSQHRHAAGSPACCVVVILLALPLLLAANDARQAARNVQQGLAHFQQGQFAQAADAFDKAGEDLPDDARIDFDRACAVAATAAADGDAAGLDRAVQLFQNVAASTDPQLAAASRYCLGCLAAIKAKSIFGDKPQDALPEIRSEGLAALELSVAHYRDTLELDPRYEDARYNLETIRHWISHMKDLWQQRDRQKKRESMNLIDYVLMLEEQQQAVRHRAQELAKQTDTPLWREQLDEARTTQQELAREIEPLKEKISDTLARPQGSSAQQPGAATQPAMPTADVQKAAALLGSLADQAATEMTTAADQLRSARLGDARRAQAAAVEMLDQIYMAVVPYPDLVKRAVDTQRQLVAHTTDAVGTAKAAVKNEVDRSQPTSENNATGHKGVTAPVEAADNEKSADEKPEFNPSEAAWRQRFITRWSEVMAAKAKQGLKQLPPPESERSAADESIVATPRTDSTATEDPIEKQPSQSIKDQPEIVKPADAPADPAEAKNKKIEALRKSMQLAVKLAPRVETLTDEAAADLEEKQLAPALPKQEEALRLLEEIARPLQDENQQNQQQQDQQQQNQQQKQQNPDNENQKDQQQSRKQQNKNQQAENKEGKDKQEQDQKQQKKQDEKQGKKEDKKPSQKKKNMQGKDKGKQDKQRQKTSPQQAQQMKQKQGKTKDQKQAEAILRRARQRQQQHREMKEAVEAELYRPGTVEKDW